MKLCSICNKDMEQIRLRYPVRVLKTFSDIEDWSVCLFCMIDHCTSTTCFGCRFGKYPGCQFLDMKKHYMKTQ